MKSKVWRYLAPLLIIPVVLLTFSCARQKIKSEPYAGTAAQEAARQKAAEEARQKELERQRAIKEESLREEQLAAQHTTGEQATARSEFVNEDIHFAFDSITLNTEAQAILRKKAQWLKAHPTVTVTIEGHCDERGTNEYNLALGDRRAHSAKVFLIDLGIDPSRINTVSYGEERPLDRGRNEAAWARNRRDHFVINK